MRHATFTLRIERADDAAPLDKDEHDALSGAIQDAEDVVNDNLPDGYYAKIDAHPGLEVRDA